MADFDASALAVVAQGLIDKFGEAVTLRTFAPAAVDEAMPWRKTSDPVPSDQTGLRAVFLPQQSQALSPRQYADGEAQRIGDLQAYLGASLGNPPDVGSVLVRGNGSAWTVKSVTPLDPNGVNLLFTLWVRL